MEDRLGLRVLRVAKKRKFGALWNEIVMKTSP